MLGRSLKAPLPTAIHEELPLLFDKSFNDTLSTTLPPLSFPPLPSPFPSPLTNLNLPHLIKSSPFSNLPPQPHPLTFFPSNTKADY